MIFAHPMLLWFLLLVPIVGAISTASRRSAGAFRRVILLTTRMACFAAAILALARPLLPTRGAGQITVAVIDVSPSAPDDEIIRAMSDVRTLQARMSRADELRVIAFAERVGFLDVLNLPDREKLSALRKRLGDEPVAGGSTSLGDALRAAGASIPDGARATIVLHTDGLQTRGDAAGECAHLARRGIAVSAKPMQPRREPFALIDRVVVPPAALVGQTAPLNVVVRSNQDVTARIEASVEGKIVATSEPFSLRAGRAETTLSIPFTRPGLADVETRLVQMDSQKTLDVSTAGTFVGSPVRVTVIDGAPDRRTESALTKLLGSAASVQTAAPDRLDQPARFADSDLLVLANLPADRVSVAAQENIKDAVASGLGLLITGGANSFGPGGWSDAPLAQILPVRMPQELQRQDPSATAVFIIDTSGSMTGPRISLAKEIVRLALRRLEPHDKAGIVEFYGSKRWAAPIQSAGNHLDLNRALNRLTAGGGTVIFPAIQEAEFALRNVNTRTRHVIILTDGGVESGPFETLIRRMTDQGVTVSTVLVGPGQYSAFLASIAQWGRGRFYHAPDRFSLPELLLHQPQTDVPPPVVQTPSRLSVRDADDVTRDIDFTAAPPLNGFVRTQPRPAAQVLLQADGQPILTRWRHGRGRVAVLATDLGSAWTGELSRWTGSPVLVSNLVRSLHAVPREQRLKIVPIVRPAGVEVQIDLQDPVSAAQAAAVAVELFSSGATAPIRRVTADPIRPGSWNILLTGVPSGRYELRALADDGVTGGRAGVTIPLPRELSSDRPNLALFEQIAGNPVVSLPSTSAGATRIVELWPTLTIASLVMFLLNIIVRRLPNQRLPSVSITSAVAAIVVVLLVISPATAAVATTTVASSQPSTRSVEEAIEAGDMSIAAALLKQHPADSNVLSLLAISQEIAGDDQAAAESLVRAIELEKDSSRASRLRLRLAVLLFDREGGTVSQSDLQRASAATQPAAPALIALLYGNDKLAADTLRGAEAQQDLFQLLLKGTSLLRDGESDAARACFANAVPLAKQQRDRRFITDRIVTAARQSGNLPALADDWMADKDLPTERLLPLLGILRELSRTDDVLALWKRPTDDPAWRQLIASPRFVAELIAITRDANRLSDAEAICRAALVANTHDQRWLDALTSILIEQDRTQEVDAVLRDEAVAADSPMRILRATQRAKSLGRDDLAIEFAARGAQFGLSHHVTSLLLEAEIESHRGNRDKAIQTLHSAAALSKGDAKLLVNVAEAFEQAGDSTSALALYRDAATNGEDVLQRLAWLLEREGKLVDAQAIWEKLWRTAGSPARKREAQNRLLDLASRTGTIADLATELEDKLAAGKANGEDLSLLIDIYVGARDPASASEILTTFKHLAGSERDALDQLARLYLKCGRFGQADRALRQLVAVDPDHAIDTLQELAVLAIERNRPADARAALEEIAKRTGSDSSVVEARAGVYEQLGLFAEAAGEYRRALHLNPDQVEDWVLWAGAMNQAQQKPRAVNRLLVLAQQADSDDLFAVAIDGLLNLEAERAALRVARRCAISRVAADPRKLVLYQLIRDLSEAMGDLPAALRAGELSLLVAGEQRTELLRELITLCKQSGQSHRSVEFGQTLLALGDEVPPQVFLDIGRQLLDDGRLAEADRAFSRAQEVATDDDIRRQVARIYEAVGQTRLALNALRPLVSLHANDVELRCRVGGMLEQLGDHDAAFGHYLEALTLVLRRGTTGGLAASTAPTTGRARMAPRQGASLTEADQFLDALVQGLIVCARTDAMRQRLLTSMRTLADAELAVAKGYKVPDVCAQRAALLRRFAFALHEPDTADAFDLAVATRFPKDLSFATSAVAKRAEWGLFPRAASLAKATGQPEPAEAALRRAVSLGVPESQTNDPDVVSRLAPQLILDGQPQRAVELLAATTRRPPNDASTIPLLLTVAAAVGDQTTAEQWQVLWLTRCETRRGGAPDVAEIMQCVRIAWPAISQQARRNMLTRVSAAISRVQEDDRAQLALLCLRMAVSLGEDAPTRTRLATDAIPAASASGATLAELLAAVEPDDRPPLLKLCVESAPPAKRRALLLQLVGASQTSIEGPLLDTLVQLFTAAANPPGDRREFFVATWAKNPAQLPAIRRLVESLSSDGEDDAQLSITLAQAMQTVGDQPAADQRATQVIRQMLASPKRARLDGRTLGDAVAVLSPAAASDLLKSTSTQPAKPNSLELLAHAILLDHLGRRTESIEAYKSAFLANPSDSEIRRLFTDRLEDDLRWADLLEIFGPFMNDDGVVNQPQRFRLQKAYRQLGRYRDAAAMYKDDGPLRQLQRLQMGVESGATTDLLGLFRSFHVDNRWERRSFTPFMQPLVGVGGMTEFLDRGTQSRARISIYRLVAALPWGPVELEALLASVTPDATEIPTLATALATACATPDGLDRFTSQLSARISADALTSKDDALLTAVLQEGVHLAPELTAKARARVALKDPLDLSACATVAKSLRDNGQADRADAVDRWITALTSMLRGSKFLQNRSTFTSTPDISFASADKKQLATAAPAPGDGVDDRTEAARLERLAELDPNLAEAALGDLRHRVTLLRSSHPQLTALWARLAAQRGDLPEFTVRAQASFDSRANRLGVDVIDVTLLLPRKSPSDASIPLAQSLRQSLHKLAQAQPQRIDSICRSICLLGGWCAENGIQSEAEECLAVATALGTESGEHQLWLADLARCIGKDNVADQIELSLAKSRALPRARAWPLISRVRVTQGSPAASALAEQIGKWCVLPEAPATATTQPTR